MKAKSRAEIAGCWRKVGKDRKLDNVPFLDLRWR